MSLSLFLVLGRELISRLRNSVVSGFRAHQGVASTVIYAGSNDPLLPFTSCLQLRRSRKFRGFG